MTQTPITNMVEGLRDEAKFWMRMGQMAMAKSKMIEAEELYQKERTQMERDSIMASGV